LSYLYGDSTPSTLQVNYIDFVRDALDFCVQVLLADQRMLDGRAHIATQEQARSREMERLEKLGGAVARAVTTGPPGDADSATARCAAAIVRAAEDLVRAQLGDLRTAFTAEIAKVEAGAAAEREGCTRALEALLRKHDLPETTLTQQLVITGGGRYACRARLLTAFGLEALVELEVPPGHLFAEAVRVERVLDRLEIQAPEVGGWLHKEVKLRPQRLERHYVTELLLGPDESTIKLRTTTEGASSGFDVVYRNEAPLVRLLRVEERDGAGLEPFDVAEADAVKLQALREKLATGAAEIARHRKTVQKAVFDGEPLGAGDRLPALVDRLVVAMAPVVQEIAARSLAAGELVLRRLLGDDRREEIFVSKADLQSKVEALRESNRALFDPLWADAGSAMAARRPPPLPPARERKTTTPPFGSPLPGPIVPLPAEAAPADPAHADREASSATPAPTPR
jgi:hypothetical protein